MCTQDTLVYNMYCIMCVPKAMYVPEIHPGANRTNITQPHMCLVNTIPDIFPLLHLNSLARSPSREPLEVFALNFYRHRRTDEPQVSGAAPPTVGGYATRGCKDQNTRIFA